MVVPGSAAGVQVGPPACRVPHAERGARTFHLKVHSEVAGAAPTTGAGLDIGFALGFPGCLEWGRHGSARAGRQGQVFGDVEPGCEPMVETFRREFADGLESPA